MYILSVVLFLIAIWPIYAGWRALITERPTFFVKSDDARKESGVFGLTGSAIMAIAGYILCHQPNVYLFGGPTRPDSFGCGAMMFMVAGITFGMCGLCWFTKTKLAFWIDNRRWPSDEEHKEAL